MPTVKNLFLNHQKIFLILLFFILSGIFLPKIALGFSIDPTTFKCTEDKIVTETHIVPGFNSSSLTTISHIEPSITADKTSLSSFGLKCFNYYTAYVVAGSGSWMLGGAEWLGNIAKDIFKDVMSRLIKDPTGYWSITREKEQVPAGSASGLRDTVAGGVFLSAWAMVKGWANILIVLGFLGVALAFILNLDQYKKLLVPLLIVAVLINFSVVFVGLMIDASNIVMKQFTGQSDAEGNIIYTLNQSWNDTLKDFPINNISDAFKFFGLSLSLALVYLVLAITLLALAVIFIERFVMLGILFVFSPLAFVFYVFPLQKTKEVFGWWWQNFLKWCFVGVIGVFFVHIGALLLEALRKANFDNVPLVVAQGEKIGDATKIATEFGTLFFGIFIVIIFLIVALRLTFKSAGWASGIVLGGAAALGTMAAAKGYSMLKSGAKRVADSPTALGGAAGAVMAGPIGAAIGAAVGNRLGQRPSDAYKSVRDTVLYRGPGRWIRNAFGGPGANAAARAESNQAELNDKNRVARVENMPVQERVQVLRANRPGSGAQFDRAAIYKKMHQDGQLDMLNQNEQLRFAQEAMRNGVSSQDTVTKLRGATQAHIIQNGLFDPQTRANVFKSMADKKELDLLTMAEQINGATEAAANGIRLPELTSKMSSDVQAHVITNSLFTPEARGKAGESLMKKGDLDLIQGATPAATNTLRQRTFEEMLQIGVDAEDIEKSSHHYADYNRARLQRLGASPALIAAGGPALAPYRAMAREQVLSSRIGSMGGDELRSIDPGNLYNAAAAFTPANPATHNSFSYRLISRMKPEQIREFEFAPQDQRDALRTHLDELDHNILDNETQAAAARAAGDQARATHHTNEALKLGSVRRAIDNLP